MCESIYVNTKTFINLHLLFWAQSAGIEAVEYPDPISADESDNPPNECPRHGKKASDSETLILLLRGNVKNLFITVTSRIILTGSGSTR